MSEKNVKFTKHALKRAVQRKLWPYVNKKKFYYDAQYVSPEKAILDECMYVSRFDEDNIRIVTMYKIS